LNRKETEATAFILAFYLHVSTVTATSRVENHGQEGDD